MSTSTISLILTKEGALARHPDKRYLGNWCIDYQTTFKDICAEEKLVLPNILSTIASVETYQYIKQVDQALFPQLCQFLNEFHAVKRSVRYWRIIVGYWWIEFIENLYARYMSINMAADLLPEAEVMILDPSHKMITPYDTRDYSLLNNNDFYNYQIFSQIIHFSKRFSITTVTKEELSRVYFDEMPTLRSDWANTIKKIICFFSKRNRFYFTSTYLDKKTLLKMAMHFGQFPVLGESPRFICSADREIRLNMRAPFTLFKSNDEFETLITGLLPTNFPKIYLEDFAKLKQSVQRYFTKRPVKSLLTAAAFADNEGFKLFAAEQTEHYQTPYIIAQHGGCYGSVEWHHCEDYEKNIADHYLSYGWTEHNTDKVIPFIANRFSQYNENVVGQKEGDILLLLSISSKYPRMLLSTIEGPSFVDYLTDQSIFLSTLPMFIRNKIRVRPHQVDKNWNVVSYIEQQSSCSLQRSNPKLPLSLEAKKSRLVVCTHNGTTHLETFALNIPTLLYWDPRMSPLRSSAKSIHQKLIKLGILHEDPTSAANFLVQIFDHALEWWQQSDVQAVRKEFCESYAATSSNHVLKWQQIIHQLSKK